MEFTGYLEGQKETICNKHLMLCRSPQYLETAKDESRNGGSLLLWKASSTGNHRMSNHGAHRASGRPAKWRPKDLLGWEKSSPQWGYFHSSISAAVVMCKVSALEQHIFFLTEFCRVILCQHLKFIKNSLTSTHRVAIYLLHSISW